ncbi:MAG: CPBP family intramembrane metalloprotease [Lachnospiraceae bacterium]|nr:CPBP family intramembrane metalloprotease [Lachnospiraceae bacterium]
MNNKVFLNKIWEILKPFLVYYILHNVIFVLILFLCRVTAEGLGEEYLTYLTEHAETVTGLVSGLSMLLCVLPLRPWLRSELAGHKAEADCVNRRSSVQGKNMTEEGRRGDGLHKAATMGLTIVLAVTASLGLNILLTLTGLVGMSEEYGEVADRQYGVAFGAGMILYGLISPIAEEIVFRGLIFNRMRRYFPHMAAVIASGVLFGIYHGNVVQGLYGGCMGILMAYLYERSHSFVVPCLFHATANMVVYVVAQSIFVQSIIFTVHGCVVLLIISVACVFIIEKIRG